MANIFIVLDVMRRTTRFIPIINWWLTDAMICNCRDLFEPSSAKQANVIFDINSGLFANLWVGIKQCFHQLLQSDFLALTGLEICKFVTKYSSLTFSTTHKQSSRSLSVRYHSSSLSNKIRFVSISQLFDLAETWRQNVLGNFVRGVTPRCVARLKGARGKKPV